MKRRYYIQPTTTGKLYWLCDSHGKQYRKLFYNYDHAVLTCVAMNTLHDNRVEATKQRPLPPHQMTIEEWLGLRT